jgi:hypothetical protein
LIPNIAARDSKMVQAARHHKAPMEVPADPNRKMDRQLERLPRNQRNNLSRRSSGAVLLTSLPSCSRRACSRAFRHWKDRAGTDANAASKLTG